MARPRITFPFILVNFKVYIEGIGQKGLNLAKEADMTSKETSVCFGVAPQYTDIRMIAESTRLPVFAQHIDPVHAEKNTGAVLPEAVYEAGAVGSIINHSERMLEISAIDQAIRRAKQVGLISVVCTNSPKISQAVATLSPDIIAYEPPELIGTGVSVSKARPEAVTEALDLVRMISLSIPILCGAGISTPDDVSIALKLGTKGVLLSSGVVKAKEPSKLMLDMARACK